MPRTSVRTWPGAGTGIRSDTGPTEMTQAVYKGADHSDASVRLYPRTQCHTPLDERTDFLILMSQVMNLECATELSEHEPTMTDRPQEYSQKAGFPASWLVSTEDDVLPESEWFNDPTVMRRNHTVDWHLFFRSSLQPLKDDTGTVLGPPLALTPIRRRGIAGPVVPICYVRDTDAWRYILLFTTAGPPRGDGTKVFYRLMFRSSVHSTAGTEVHRFRTAFGSVAGYFEARGAERGVDVLEELKGPVRRG